MNMPEIGMLAGNTSLLGQVMRVGAVEPRVRLKLASGKILSCETSETIAKQLGGRLYEIVSCKGEATWDRKDDSLIKFKIKAVNAYVFGKASDAFSALAKAMPETLARWHTDGLENVFPTDAA